MQHSLLHIQGVCAEYVAVLQTGGKQGEGTRTRRRNFIGHRPSIRYTYELELYVVAIPTSRHWPSTEVVAALAHGAWRLALSLFRRLTTVAAWHALRRRCHRALQPQERRPRVSQRALVRPRVLGEEVADGLDIDR